MANLHGRNAEIWIDDVDGESQAIRGDLQSITLNQTNDTPDSTTFGNRDVQRMDGLRDISLDVTALFNSENAGYGAVTALLDAMFANSLVHRVQYAPAGSVTGCPIYTASMRLSNYVFNQPTDGIVTHTFSLVNAAGSMVAACAV